MRGHGVYTGSMARRDHSLIARSEEHSESLPHVGEDIKRGPSRRMPRAEPSNPILNVIRQDDACSLAVVGTRAWALSTSQRHAAVLIQAGLTGS